MQPLALPITGRVSAGPWLWGPARDLAVFGGSGVLAFALVLLGRVTGISARELPEWTWLVCVLAVDVAHVHSTLVRTYLDGDELRARPLRYLSSPLLVYLAGVALYAHGAMTFWRVLAYVAVFHFVRQQVGWVAVYRARARQSARIDRVVDEAVVYASTVYPIVHWHAAIDTAAFSWFMVGDFVHRPEWFRAILPAAEACWAAALIAFAFRQLQLLFATNTIHVGKVVVVLVTAASWYIGIVASNSDYDFTVTNVLVHGIPYLALLWMYAGKHAETRPLGWTAQLVSGGVAGFCGVFLILAFIEELAWDRLVWHERGWLFGTSDGPLGEIMLMFVVPLLALPQALHYVLDGMLWRRAETRRLPAQRAALGFEPVTRDAPVR